MVRGSRCRDWGQSLNSTLQLFSVTSQLSLTAALSRFNFRETHLNFSKNDRFLSKTFSHTIEVYFLATYRRTVSETEKKWGHGLIQTRPVGAAAVEIGTEGARQPLCAITVPGVLRQRGENVFLNSHAVICKNVAEIPETESIFSREPGLQKIPLCAAASLPDHRHLDSQRLLEESFLTKRVFYEKSKVRPEVGFWKIVSRFVW